MSSRRNLCDLSGLERLRREDERVGPCKMEWIAHRMNVDLERRLERSRL